MERRDELRFSATPGHDVLAMAERAGIVEPVREGDLRPLDGGLFMAVADRDRASHPVEFLDHDTAGRAHSIFNFDGGRTLVRVDPLHQDELT